MKGLRRDMVDEIGCRANQFTSESICEHDITSRRCCFFCSATPRCCGCKHMNFDVESIITEILLEIICKIISAMVSAKNMYPRLKNVVQTYGIFCNMADASEFSFMRYTQQTHV